MSASRPVISSLSTSTVKIGGSVTITMEDAVTSFVLIRMSATTHTVNTDQRHIPLTPRVNGLEYTVWVPEDAGVAVAGIGCCLRWMGMRFRVWRAWCWLHCRWRGGTVLEVA